MAYKKSGAPPGTIGALTTEAESSDSSSDTVSPGFIDYQSLPTIAEDCELTPAPEVPEEIVCPTCTPNPGAPLTDWTKTSELEPFLNGRKCTYSICLTTKYQGTGGIGTLQPRLDEYIEEGTMKLLAHFDKALDENTIAAAVALAGATDHFIPPRARLKMKVLIEIPANEFDRLPNSSDIPEVAEAVKEIEEDLGLTESKGSATVDLELFDQQMDKLIEGLKVYAKYQAIFYQTQRGAVRYPGGAPVNLQTEADNLRKIRPKLYEWLRTKGWVLRTERGKSARAQPEGKLKEAEKIEFGFGDDFKITSITLYPHGTCANDPTVISGMQVFTLTNMEPFNRPTTMNWIANIEACEDALIQRQGMMKWTEFAEKFIHPKPTIHQGADMGSTVAAIASASTGQATEKDLEIIHKSTITMSDAEKLEAKTPGSWKNYPGKLAGGAQEAYKKQKGKRSEAGFDEIVDHLTTPASREVSLTSGALAESERNAKEWPYKSNDPNSPTYRGQQEIWDPSLNGGQGGYRMETEQEAHNRSNANLASQNSHLVTSSDVIEDLCDGFSLGDALNDLGEDFMNELFSIWDALSYQFHNFICMTPEQRAELLQKLQDGTADAQSAAIREATKILVGFMEMINSLRYSLEEVQDIKALYPKALDEITFCGLFDLMTAFIECLAQGFDLEELLKPLLMAALSAMPPMELEKLFVGLPPEDQAAVLAKVQAELGSHTMPWDAKMGPDGKMPKDPSAESPFGNRPMAGSTGRSMAVTSGGLAKERGEARQDHTEVTPKLQGIVREMEGYIESKQKDLETVAEQEAAALREAYEADPTTGDQYARAREIDQSEAISEALLENNLAAKLSSYLVTYEIPGYSGATMSAIQAAPASYITAVQDVLTRVNSSSTVTVFDPNQGADPFPDRSSTWKSFYYENYSREFGELKAQIDTSYPDGPGDPAYDGALATAANHADLRAQELATEAENADQGRLGDPGPFGTRGSLGAAVGSTVSTAISAYVKAIIEHYSDVGLDKLKDYLEGTKGGQIIAKVIALMDCVLPPLFDPPLLDFLNTLQIDFCNMVMRMTLPELPAIQMPNWKDFFKWLLMIAEQILLYIAFRLLVWLLTKIIMMLFDSLCSALEKLAEAAMAAIADAACQALSDVGGEAIAQAYEDADMCESPPRNMLDMMKEAFCGPGASDAQAQEAANTAMRNMGAVTEADAAKMANPDAVSQLVADMSAVLTGGELTNLLLGNPDPVAAGMVKEIIHTENPDFKSAFGNEGQISELFKNIGNLLPMDMKIRLRAGQDTIPAERPANPFLCTTNDEIERFKSIRRNILTAKDGTTPAQADQQFDAMRGRALNDITEMATIMQGGVEAFLADNMPPILGEPDENGCIPENALIPRDPDQMMEIVGATNEKLFDIVGRAYSRDIVGERGCLSMVLSDVNGIPWRRHQRKTRDSIRYSDYEGEVLDMFGLDSIDSLPDAVKVFFEPVVSRETGYYPKYVGQYFREYMQENRHNPDGYVTTTEHIPSSYEYFTPATAIGSIIPLGFFPLSPKGLHLGTEDNPFFTRGRKMPDLTLKFRDNNRGIHPSFLPEEMKFSDGFNLEYSSYVIDDPNASTPVANTENVYQLRVVDVENPLPWTPTSLRSMIASPLDLFSNIDPTELVNGIEDERFTLTITGSLSEAATELRSQYNLSGLNLSPQANLWNDYILSKYKELAISEADETQFNNIQPFMGASSGSITHDNIMNNFIEYFGATLGANEASYIFGFDPSEDGDLRAEDKMYWGPAGFEDKPFIKYVWEDLADQLGDDYKIMGSIPNIAKLAKYVENNQIMGTSKHERMHFLDPGEYGGSWMKPPYYIEPPESEGWLGIRDALLPEVDGKDPKRVPVCNFEDIKERVDQLTKKMPDDPRLSECPDCVEELPYSRILDRASAAGMEGPILALIRIYVVEEMVKAMPLFSKFKATIPEVMDYTYVEYILANMKEDFTQRLGRKRGFLKGDALWYTFLEQCVQSFARQIQLDSREVEPAVQNAIDALNSVQESFKYPTEEQWKYARRIAGQNPWAVFGIEDTATTDIEPEVVFDRKVGISTRLNWYRRWHLLQAVRDSEHHANTIVRVLIEEQLEYMSDRFAESLDDLGMAPDVKNIYEFFISDSGFVAGASEYNLTAGPQEGQTPEIFNVGRYNEITGKVTSPLEQYETSDQKLDVTVYLNDDPYLSVNSYASRYTTGEFFLEKYIYVKDKNQSGLSVELPELIANRPSHINGVVNIDDWKEWLESIAPELGDRRLSEFFGDFEFTYASDVDGNPTDTITGVVGEMGVRYGLRLSYVPPAECAPAIEEFFEGLKESENWPLINARVNNEKSLIVDRPNLSRDSALNLVDAKVVDSRGIPIPVLSEDQRAIVDAIMDGTYGFTMAGYTVPGSEAIIPVASTEYDALDHTISEHIVNIDTDMDLYCLGRDLVRTPEFELMFQYVFPLNRITSLMGIYTGMGFFMSIGEKVLEADFSDIPTLFQNGYPKPDQEAGEWQAYAIRRLINRGGRTYDGWDFESLFPKTKKRLVRMFRSYFKSREFLSHKDDEENTDNEKSRKSSRKDNSSKKGKRGGRGNRRRRRDRPFDKFGN